jgi:excisionase family DNA binding protein
MGRRKQMKEDDDIVVLKRKDLKKAFCEALIENKEELIDMLNDNYISPEQVKKIFGISQTTFDNWIKNGYIKYVKIGDRRKVSQNEVKRIIDYGRMH